MRQIMGVLLLFVIAGCTTGTVPEWKRLERMIRKNRKLVLIDVRERQDYIKGHIPTAVNIPLADIMEKPGIVPRGNPLVLYCYSGVRSGKALVILRKAGLKKIINFGGIPRWKGKRISGEAPGTL